MTDTGQVPGEGLPENAGMVEQPGAHASGAYTYLSETPAQDEDLLLLPGAQGAWGNEVPPPPPAPVAEVVHEPGPHERAGRDSGSVDLGGVRMPAPASSPAPQPPVARRPLHLGPPTPDSAGSPVRSLADRGPAGAPAHPVPVRQSGPPTVGPEYLDIPCEEMSLQGSAPWGAQSQTSLQAPVQAVAQAAPPVPQLSAEGAAAETVVRGAWESAAAGASPASEPAFEGGEIGGTSQAAEAGQAAQAPDFGQITPDAPVAEADPDPGPGPEVDQGSAETPMTEPAQAPQDTGSAQRFASAPQEPEASHFPRTAEPPVPVRVAADQAQVPQHPLDHPHVPSAAHSTEPQFPAPAEQFTEATPQASTAEADETARPAFAEQAHAAQVEQAPHAAAAPETAQTAQTPQYAEPAEAPPQFAAPALAEAPEAMGAHAGEPQNNEPHSEAAPAPDAPLEPQADRPVGQFVPVEGTVPAAPHLAPTPPHGMTVPPLPETEHPAAEEPAKATDLVEATEPPAPEEPVALSATRGVEPAPEAEATAVPETAVPETAVPESPVEDPGPQVAEHAEDLDIRAAEQEESTAAVAEVRESAGTAAPGYDDAEREAVLRVMRERRDIRNGFRGDPIPHEVLLRVLEAAHTAPSVGHSQPWDFVVIRSGDTRRTMHELAMRQRDAYAKSLPKGRAKQFKELKIEAILDTPVNIVVTADPTRGGRHTLGRHTQPQMAPYSSALAVENLWLAARAEGLGVGWVSFFDEREMVRALGLPEHLEVVAYLCVGYVDEFPDEPELMQAGWSKRRPLSWVVHEETYGRRALPGEGPHDLLAETVFNIRPLDAKALGEAWERQKRMTKPAGALGMLEIISAQLSGLSRMCPPPIPEPAAVAIFAGDHGVHAQGVTPWPQEVTGQMVANILGGGAVANAFATQVGSEVCVVDVGVASDLPATPGLLPRKVRAGTADMTTGPALTREEVRSAIEVGIETARDLVAAGNKALITGEMGIANTTASAALISVFTDTDPSEVTGRGTGINDETLARKTEVVRRAIELHQPDPADPLGVLAAVGGLEHAAMVGLLLGGASLRTPVILDGVSAGAAALVARAIAPEVLAACIAGHRSAEPGHVAALNKLGLRPLVDLDLRLGEGTGALLALPMVQSAARAMHEVATFDSAGVTEK